MTKDNFEIKNTNKDNITRLMIMQTLIDEYNVNTNTLIDINGGNIDYSECKSLEFRARAVPCDHGK